MIGITEDALLSDPLRPGDRFQTRWLYGPASDLLLGCGLGYALFVAIFLFADTQALVADWVPVAIVFLGLITNSPHYGATLIRVYEKRADRRKYAFFTVYLTIALAALFVAGLHFLWMGSFLITLYITWSPWHFAGQNYGLAVMFLRRRQIEVPPGLKRLIYLSFVCSFLMSFFLIHGPLQALGLLPVPSFQREVYEFLSLGLPPRVAEAGLAISGLGYVGSILAAGTLLLRRSSLRDLAPTASLVALQAMWYAIPAFMAATNTLTFESFALSSIWIAFAHSIQYLWVTSYYSRQSGDDRRISGYMLKTLLWGSAATVFPAMVFAPNLLGTVSFHAGLGILLFSVINIHHFALDGAIWKLRDGSVARILLRTAGDNATAGVSASVEQAHGRGLRMVYAIGAVSLAVAVFGSWENHFGAVEALGRGDLSRVARASERLSWIGRESHGIHQQLGLRRAQQGQWEEARHHYERSLQIHPSVQAWYSLAQLHVARGELEAARAALEPGLELQPDHLLSLELLGRVWSELGDPTRARAVLEKAAALMPGNHAIAAALVRARHEESKQGDASPSRP